jgi:predicted nucleic acid-binding protein
MQTDIKYLLDTNTISDHLRNRKGPVGIWMDAHIEVSGISVITLAELRSGIEGTTGKLRTRLETLFRYTLEDYRHAIFDFDQKSAME